jgi:hypothetical protein
MPWVPTGKMNSARYGHTTTLFGDGKVLVASGGNGSLSEDKMWRVLAHTATLLADGRVLVSGGFSHSGGPTTL